jgi:hypothetical protein
MKRLFIVISLLALAGAAGAQPTGGATMSPGITTVCLDVDGSTLPVTCHAQASLIRGTEDICLCNAGGSRTDVPLCLAGERQPGESVALNRARRDAGRDGSLVGDTVNGAPICVEPHGT